MDEDNQGVPGFIGLPMSQAKLISVVPGLQLHKDAVFEGKVADEMR
jgi:hypothetical protein